MCGIAGIWNRDGTMSPEDVLRTGRAMTATLAHRGPDGAGEWLDADAGVALGQRRLAIIDLSDAGSAPMVSSCGRYALTYNGEIYNASEIRPDLTARGVAFRGHSDTEVLLEACAAWGVGEAVERSIGMFAFALFDLAERRLTLGRDRLGIKPLYWTDHGGCVAFASELKAFDAWEAWQPSLDEAALGDYLRHACVPAPRTIFREARKLEPGHLLRFEADGEPRHETFWSLGDVVAGAAETPCELDEAAAIDALEELLGSAVSYRLVSDVPLGAFLSGGIDSSAVLALMQQRTGTPVRSFTIGFAEAAYDEAKDAREVAGHLGADHTELVVSPSEARAIIPRLPEIYDEPFADSSQIPTFLVSRMTAEHVTVALSGDGGDEVFAGYNRHVVAAQRDAMGGALPRSVSRAAGRVLESVSPGTWDRAASLLPSRVAPRLAGEKMHKLGRVIGADDDRFYSELTSVWPDVSALRPDVGRGASAWGLPEGAPDLHGSERVQFRDTIGYLPDDILTKVDRASMAVGLEVRVPMLDHRVVEFAWSLPRRMRIRGRTGKWLLRQMLARHVPETMFDRPKMGFGVPVDEWLRGPLREWAGDLLASARSTAGGLFEAAPIERAWSDHLEGRRNTQHALWTILMFQAWQQSRRQGAVTNGN